VDLPELAGRSFLEGNNVFPNNQNPLNQQPGKVVTDVEKYQTISGQVVKIRRVELSILDGNMLRKEKCFEVDPPLTDNRIPDSVADIRECRICFGLFHKDNVLNCPACGGYFCHRCRDYININDSEVPACAECTKEANTGVIRKIIKKFWTLGD